MSTERNAGMTPRTPARVQRKRTRGWRMPEGAVYVGRPGPWGNPFRVGHDVSVSEIANQETA